MEIWDESVARGKKRQEADAGRNQGGDTNTATIFLMK